MKTRQGARKSRNRSSWAESVAKLACTLALLSAWGCTGSASGTSEAHGQLTPHGNVLCLDGRQRRGCPAGATLEAFDRWVKTAVHHPGATFSLWVIGNDRGSACRAFGARVPESWGSHVLRSKTEFVRGMRRELQGFEIPAKLLPARVSCSLSAELLRGEHWVDVFSADARDAVFSTMIRVVPSGPVGHRKALQVAVVCDRSNSGNGLSCTEPSLERVYDRWVTDSLGRTGGEFAVYLVGRSRDTAERVFTVQVPSGSPGEQAALLFAARGEIARVFAAPADFDASAIFEALHVAVTQLEGRDADRALVVMSDLRQYTAGVWNFERAVPPLHAFVEWIDKQGLRLDLRDVHVVVCGWHHLRAPGARPFDGRLAADVRARWEAALDQMGASHLRILASCDDAAVTS